MFNAPDYLAIAATRGLPPFPEPEPEPGDMPTAAELDRREQDRRMRHAARFGTRAA